MHSEQARQPMRTLELGKPAQVRERQEPAARPAIVLPPVKTPAAAPSPALPSRSNAAPVGVAEPKLAQHTAAAPAPKPTRTKAVAPMHEELTQPLSELIPVRPPLEIDGTFRDLVAHGVSDVHMTRSALDGTFVIQARVDGKMQPIHTYEGVAALTVANKIKTDSKMSSDENIVPEDGMYELPIDGYPYRARVVSLPLFEEGGEYIVFRLPQTGELRSLDDLGFIERNLTPTKELLSIPGGMTLVAGPTGEGKSTTALSTLKYLREQEDGVYITLEDPVERVIPGIKQIEVRDDVAGASFGDMMKYLVRSDANVIFIGEIRDRRTATAAVEIAKSGRRVIATIHATDNVSAFLRLMEMADAPPLSVLESVNGVVSQRLVPRLVPGANRFAGRYPVHEVTKNSEQLTDALIANVSRAAIRSASAGDTTTFAENVEELIAAGITTREEARKVVRHV